MSDIYIACHKSNDLLKIIQNNLWIPSFQGDFLYK